MRYYLHPHITSIRIDLVERADAGSATALHGDLWNESWNKVEDSGTLAGLKSLPDSGAWRFL